MTDQPEAAQPEQPVEPTLQQQCLAIYRRHQALDPKPPLPRLPEDD